MAEKQRRVPRAKRPGAYMTKKGGVVKNAKAEARAKVVAKRDAARKKVKTLENKWETSGGSIKGGPLLKKQTRAQKQVADVKAQKKRDASSVVRESEYARTENYKKKKSAAQAKQVAGVKAQKKRDAASKKKK